MSAETTEMPVQQKKDNSENASSTMSAHSKVDNTNALQYKRVRDKKHTMNASPNNKEKTQTHIHKTC